MRKTLLTLALLLAGLPLAPAVAQSNQPPPPQHTPFVPSYPVVGGDNIATPGHLATTRRGPEYGANQSSLAGQYDQSNLEFLNNRAQRTGYPSVQQQSRNEHPDFGWIPPHSIGSSQAGSNPDRPPPTTRLIWGRGLTTYPGGLPAGFSTTGGQLTRSSSDRPIVIGSVPNSADTPPRR